MKVKTTSVKIWVFIYRLGDIGCVMQFHKIKPGNPNSKLLINFVVKDINMKGSLRLDKNKPSKYANLGSD